MYLKVDNEKTQILELVGFWEKFLSLKFVIEPIKYGVKLVNKKKANTYFFCQKVDLILTNKNDKILYMAENLGTECKIKKYEDVNNIYFLPLGTVKHFRIGDILKFTDKK